MPDNRNSHIISAESVHNVHHENLNSLDRTIVNLQKTRDTSDDTRMKLAEQSEKQDRIDKDLNHINQSLDLSDRMIKGMGSITSSIGNWWSGPVKSKDRSFDKASVVFEEDSHNSNSNNSNSNNSWYTGWFGNNNSSNNNNNNSNNNTNNIHNNSIPITGSRSEREYKEAQNSQGNRQNQAPVVQKMLAERELEDSKLDDISNILSQLKIEAKEMNKDLSVQTAQQNHIAAETNRASERMLRQNKQMDKL